MRPFQVSSDRVVSAVQSLFYFSPLFLRLITSYSHFYRHINAILLSDDQQGAVPWTSISCFVPSERTIEHETLNAGQRQGIIRRGKQWTLGSVLCSSFWRKKYLVSAHRGANGSSGALFQDRDKSYRSLDNLKFYIRRECISDFVTVCYATWENCGILTERNVQSPPWISINACKHRETQGL